MKSSIKAKISRSLSHNKKLDKRMMHLKRSWDEVAAILTAKEKRRK